MPTTTTFRWTTSISVGLTAVLLAGCSHSPDSPNDQASPAAFDHIHALAATPGSDQLTVATHDGLYQLDVSDVSDVSDVGTAVSVGPVGGLDFDPMGFTLRDGIAYASDHPGPTTPATFGSPNLGLITSTDDGRTWGNVSLTGTTDFHALAVLAATDGGSGARIFGIDTTSQSIQRSLDGGATWPDGTDVVARDLLALPSSDVLYATTEKGLAVSTDNAATFTTDPAAPSLYLVNADPVTESLAGVDVGGSLWTTTAAGQWKKGGDVVGVPQAFLVTVAGMYVADDRGIAWTDDLGLTWTVVKVSKS